MPENYRPISIIPVMSKIIEKHFAYKINNYQQKKNLLHPNQFDFIPGHSCQTALTI